MTIRTRWLTHLAEIKAMRVGFPSGDLGLIVFFVSEASDASSILAIRSRVIVSVGT